MPKRGKEAAAAAGWQDKYGSRIRGEYEENTKGIRREYDSNTLAPHMQIACTWLVSRILLSLAPLVPGGGQRLSIQLQRGQRNRKDAVGAARQSHNRTARSVWSARSLLPLWCARDRSKAPASWTHSKRFAWQFTHKNPRSLRTTSTVAMELIRNIAGLCSGNELDEWWKREIG